MKLKKIIFLTVALFLLLASEKSYGQVNTGGNVSISYDKGVYIDIAPIIGYKFEDLKINTGASPILSYKKPEGSGQTIVSAGARVFGQYYFIENAYLHGEFQTLNTQTTILNADGSKHHSRVWTIALPVGAGYEYKLNDKARVQASILYDLLQDKNSPNKLPIVRGGIVYDL